MKSVSNNRLKDALSGYSSHEALDAQLKERGFTKSKLKCMSKLLKKEALGI